MRLLRALSNPVLEISKYREHTGSLGKLFQCLTVFVVKKLFQNKVLLIEFCGSKFQIFLIRRHMALFRSR